MPQELFPPGTKKERLRIGKIIGSHGLKGCLKVYSDAESHAAFTDYGPLFIRGRQGVDPELPWAVLHVQAHKGPVILLVLNGIASRDAADALLGGILCADRANFPEPEEGYYYWADLMGLEVRALSGESLGHIRRVLETGGNDLFEVVKEKREFLIPANAEVVREVELEKGYLTVVLPEGLLDL